MITVSGAGERAFCAGADISEFGERRTGEAAVAAYGAAVKEANAALADTAKPTVALIKGICFGGGFALAMCCDLGSRRRIPLPHTGGATGSRLRDRQYREPRAAHRHGRRRRPAPERPDPRCERRRALTASSTWPGRARNSRQRPRPTSATWRRMRRFTMQAVKRTLRELALPESERDMAAADALVGRCFASEDYAEGQRAFRESVRRNSGTVKAGPADGRMRLFARQEEERP